MPRASIAWIRSDGSGQFVFLFHGAPLEYGAILSEHYRTAEQVDELLALGNLSSVGPIIGERIDFKTRAGPNSLNPKQCIAYHRDRNEPWERCRPRQLTGGLGQFHQVCDEESQWLYAHTPDGCVTCRRNPAGLWGSVTDAIVDDASALLAPVKDQIRARALEPAALTDCLNDIAAISARPWQPPALRQLLAEAINADRQPKAAGQKSLQPRLTV